MCSCGATISQDGDVVTAHPICRMYQHILDLVIGFYLLPDKLRGISMPASLKFGSIMSNSKVLFYSKDVHDSFFLKYEIWDFLRKMAGSLRVLIVEYFVP